MPQFLVFCVRFYEKALLYPETMCQAAFSGMGSLADRQGVCQQELFPNAVFGSVPRYLTHRTAVMNIGIPGREYRFLTGMVVQAGTKQEGGHMLQLVGTAQLKIGMNTETGIDLNGIEVGQPTT